MTTAELTNQIRACRLCAQVLPHEPRPVFAWSPESRLSIIGQAPGRKVHESGVPWQDASGRLLREWMEVSESIFYDSSRVALLPMGFCYPGKGTSGDLPPRPECAPHWHTELFSRMKERRLTLLVGKYAQDYYLGERSRGSLTDNVRHYHEFIPGGFPLPHPSPRNRPWLRKNPWFQEDVLPTLKSCVAKALEASND